MLGCRHASLNRLLKSLQFYINWYTMEFLCLSHALQAPEISHALWYLKLQETIILQILNLLLGSYYQYLHFCGPCFFWLTGLVRCNPSSLYSISTITSYSESNDTLMEAFLLCDSRGSQIIQKREKIILYPSFCMYARLCSIITLPRFISPQNLLDVVFTPRVQLPPEPLSFAFPARDCRQDSLKMHPTQPT